MSYCVNCGVELDPTASVLPAVPHGGGEPQAAGGYPRCPKPFPAAHGGGGAGLSQHGAGAC